MIYEFKLSKDFGQSEIYENISFSCENNDEYFSVLINPACDLIIQETKKHPKANYFLFLGILPFKSVLNNILSSLRITKSQKVGSEAISPDTFNDLIETLKQFINGSIYPRYFYIPPLEGYFSHSVIDFQLIETKKFTKELREELLDKKIAQLKSSWKEALPTRFVSYSARIGVDYDLDKIVDDIFTDYKLDFRRDN